jgi:hypothetical protein
MRETKYFSKQSWTQNRRDSPSGKSPARLCRFHRGLDLPFGAEQSTQEGIRLPSTFRHRNVTQEIGNFLVARAFASAPVPAGVVPHGCAFSRSNRQGAKCISAPESRVSLRVIPTDEEVVIAEHTAKLVAG